MERSVIEQMDGGDNTTGLAQHETMSFPCSRPAPGGVIQKKRKTGPLNGNSQQSDRLRAVDWKLDETEAMFRLRCEVLLEARRDGEPFRSWKEEVSARLYDKYGYDRSSESCTDRWDTVMKEYNAICKYHSHLGKSDRTRYWDMTEDEKIKHKLPRSFSKALYDDIVVIKALLEYDNDSAKRSLRPKKGTRIRVEKDATPSTSTQNALTNLSGPSSQSHWITSSRDIPPQAPSFEALIQSCLQPCQDEVSKRIVVYKDEIPAVIAPFVHKQIQDALNSLVSASYYQNPLVVNPIKNATTYRALQPDYNMTNLSVAECSSVEDEDFVSIFLAEDGTHSQ